MSHRHWWTLLGQHAMREANAGSKFGAIVLIIIGLFLAPMLIGIPIMVWGFIKLVN